MSYWFSISEASDACPRAAARLLREWVPGWSGSVVLHVAAVCCFTAATEYGPKVWPVTRGHSSIEAAPALDARAGGMLAKMAEQTPPVAIETLTAPDLTEVAPIPPDVRTMAEVQRHSVVTPIHEQIARDISVLVSERSGIPPKPMDAEDQPLVVRVDPSSIRDDELLRSLKPMIDEAISPVEAPSESGLSANRGSAAEDSSASTAATASNGAVDNQLPQPVATNVAPPYPDEARAAGLQGKVTLRLRIGVDGRVESLKILTSSGVPSLDESALATVKQWRFEPARKLGRPVAMEVKTSVSFQIEAE